MALVELKRVFKDYETGVGSKSLPVLQDISFCVEEGESIAIMGPSGSGKSTLLNIIGTLDRPTNGQVLLEGADICECDDKKLAEIRRSKIGFIFQSHHLLPQCSALENVLVPTLAYKNNQPKEAVIERAKRLLGSVDLGERLTHRPGKLSGGERQRVAVIRALINQPVLLLADEPTGALDGKSSSEIGDILCQLNQEEKVTLIVVTHTFELASRMKKAFELRDGNLIQNNL